MQARLHLVSAPWADPLIAPIQTACLKAYVDEAFAGTVPVQTYSPFLEVILELWGPAFLRIAGHVPEPAREYVSLFAFLRRYRRRALDDEDTVAFEAALREMLAPAALTSFERANKALAARRADLAGSLDRRFADQFATELTRYTDRRLVGQLGTADVDLIGFTMNYHQVYSSAIIVSRLLERGRGKNTIMLFGGGSASHPAVRQALAYIGIPGFVVFGEGEERLRQILRLVQESTSAAEASRRIADEVHGVFAIGDRRHLVRDTLDLAEGQVEPLEQLPQPDYSQYFRQLRGLCRDEEAFVVLRSLCHVTVEGTRGCFAKCDFCSLNRQWAGFRKKSADVVVEQALALRSKYGINYLHFADNVCDTWAEDYAKRLIEHEVAVPALMELRAHHPQRFWTLLALAGVSDIQIGIEAVSPPLLKRMNKGTFVYQNLRTAKYLTELGITWAVISNLITHHPRSTLTDVAITKGAVQAMSYWALPNLSVFHLDPGSPLYESLSDDELVNSEPLKRSAWPAKISPFVVERQLALPTRWQNATLEAAWTDFSTWYERFRLDVLEECRALAVVEETTNETWLRRQRGHDVSDDYLEGELSSVYRLCHHAPTTQAVAKTLSLSEADAVSHLRGLVERQLVYPAEGRFLALALRNRDALVLETLAEQRRVTPKGQRVTREQLAVR